MESTEPPRRPSPFPGLPGGGAQAPGIASPAPTCGRPGGRRRAPPRAARAEARAPKAGGRRGQPPGCALCSQGASRRAALAAGFRGRSAERREARQRPERCRTKIRLERSASDESGPNPAQVDAGELNQITCFVRHPGALCPSPKKAPGR